MCLYIVIDKIKYWDKLDLASVLLLQLCQCQINSKLCATESPTTAVGTLNRTVYYYNTVVLLDLVQ